MISHYTLSGRQYAYYTLFDRQYDNCKYSMPDRVLGGWKWIHVSALTDPHLNHAIKLQMLAIQQIEETLADLFMADGTLDNHKQIDRNMLRMKLRYKRFSMLGDEHTRRNPKDGPFEERPSIKKWLEGSTRLEGKYPTFEPVAPRVYS